MSSIFAALGAASQSLGAVQRAIDITQNNIGNASTPGYAAQRADFTALSFDAQSGQQGGATSSASSTRQSYLDQSVQSRVSELGAAEQGVTSVSQIESSFDVTGQTGIPGTLSKLFGSFSALSVNTGDQSLRNTVVSAAQAVAGAFQQTSSVLSQAATVTDQQVETQLTQINALATEIRGYNVDQAKNAADDPGRDANLSAALEKLSSLANISTRIGVGGGTDVLLDGQIPLVLGTQQYSFSTSPAPLPSPAPANPAGPAPLTVRDSNGTDITSHFSGGSVAGLLRFRNSTLAGLRGDKNQPGSLNVLAKGFADRVNTLLTSGSVTSGPPVQAGTPLFTYDTSDATKASQSLAVVAGFTGAQLATIDPGPPSTSNGIALSLGSLSNGSAPADQINGATYAQFFGGIAGAVGAELAAQKSGADLNQQAVTQAQSLRSQLSGVSLDAEAVKLVQYQRSYSASAKLISVLDQITQTALDILK